MLKTITFAILHFTIAFGVAYALTGDFLTGGLIAVLKPACNTVAYHFDEKVWKRFGTDAEGNEHKRLSDVLRRLLRQGEST